MALTLRQLLNLDDEAFDRYEVLGSLGAGATARVLLAKDTRLGREVAVKLGSGETTADSAMRFHREAKALAALEHPNIVRVIDYSGPHSTKPFLITERVRGVDLQSLVSGAPLSELEVCAVGQMLASALFELHEHGIIHRDVKPENIMLSETGRVVLIDFGLCKGLWTDARSPGDTFIDKPTKVMGTPAFSSPEQLRGLRLTPETDLFSLGSTLYYLATDALPFHGETLNETMIAIIRQPPFPIEKIAQVTPELKKMIDALLHKDIAARTPLIQEAKGMLFRLAARGNVPFDEICKALGKARHVSVKKTDLIVDEAALRELVLGSGEISLDEVTAWNKRHQPTVAKVKAPKEPADTRANATAITKLTEPEKKKPAGRAWVLALTGAALLAALVIAFTQRPAAQKPQVTQQAQHRPEVPKQALGVGRVRLGVTPWGVVTIDGTERGMTPELRVVSLEAGPHKVVVSNPKYGRQERTVNVKADDEVLEVFDLTKGN